MPFCSKSHQGTSYQEQHFQGSRSQLHLLRRLATIVFVFLAFAALPRTAYAVKYGDYNGDGNITLEEAQSSSDIQPTHYEALNLPISPELPEGTVAPYPENRASNVISSREVYVAANGTKKNVYTLRNYLDALGPSHNQDLKEMTHSDMGQLYGAYSWYGINSDSLDSTHGGSKGSYLSWNTESVLTVSNAEFDGKYATSVPLSLTKGADARDNCIAELRAYGRNKTQKWRGNGEYYTGLIKVMVYSVAEDGTRTEVASLLPTLHESQFLSTDGYHELNYVDFGYQQEYDAYFELEAADVDGDGIDELFAYTGAYEDRDGHRYAMVYQFRTTDGNSWNYSVIYLDTGAADNYLTLQELKDRNPDPWNHKGANYWRWQLARLAPVVTIAAGDLDRDGTDEVAITTSAPTAHKKASDAATCHIFHWNEDEGNVASVKGLENIDLSDYASGGAGEGRAVVSANTTFGNFSLPTATYSYMVGAFVIAGWQSNDATAEPHGSWSSMAYRYVYFDPAANEYRVSDYKTHELGKDAKAIAQSASKKAGKTKRYMPVMAPLALGTARLERLGDGVKSDHVLAGGEVYTFNLSTGLAMSSVGSMSLYTDQYHRMSHNKMMDNKAKDHVWIGDVVSGYVANDGLAHDSFLAVVGVRRDSDVRSSDDYYWMDVAHFTFDEGVPNKVSTGQEGVVCESVRMGKTVGTYVSLCLPDIDNDSVRMRLVGKTVLPTAPQVLAVLQDTPYFAELEDSYHYLSASATSFGKSSSQSVSNGFNIAFAGGGHLNAEWNTGPAAQLDVALKAGIGYDWQVTNATGHSVTYTAQGGKGNKVVVYTVPMAYYRYEVFNPETGSWDEYIQTVAQDPVASVVSVDTWNRVAGDTESLPLIDESVIGSMSGVPETYVGTPDTTGRGLAGERYLDSGELTTVSTGGDGGANITQGASESHENTRTITPSLDVNVTTGFGAGLFGNGVKLGVIVDFEAGYTHAEVDTSGLEFAGTVDNLPQITSVVGDDSRYAFGWKLITNKIQYASDEKGSAKLARKLDDVYLVGYEVDEVMGVKRPLVGVVGDARVESVTDTTATLSWTAANFGEDETGTLCFYRVGLLGIDGKVATWHTLAAPEDTDERIFYTVEGLSPTTDYQMVVVAARGTQNGTSFVPSATSIPSPTLTLRTLEADEQIALLDNPQELDTLAVGDTAVFSVSAQWIQAGENHSDSISYMWQQFDPQHQEWLELGDGMGDSIIEVSTGEGEAVLNATTSTLVIRELSTACDGAVIRCRVGFGTQVITSSDVTLHMALDGEALVVNGADDPSQIETADDELVQRFEPVDAGEGEEGQQEEQVEPEPTPEPEREPEPTPVPVQPDSGKTVARKASLPDTGDENAVEVRALLLLAIAAFALGGLPYQERWTKR